ncbi:conserved hypothetical protein [Ricinus communis]|uniref:Uncharacterized protein n=1 Tax=Ricinus communis TaxID=3988 RepID=B9RL28_RICCO|nr:conserved hypothetical protein [Ricinus communis]
MLKKVKEEPVKQSSNAQEELAKGTKSQTSSTNENSDDEEEKSNESEKSPNLIGKEREGIERKSKVEANVYVAISSDKNSISNLLSMMIVAFNSHLTTLSKQQLCMDLKPSSNVYHLLRDIHKRQSGLEKTVSAFEKSLKEEFY